MRRVAHAVSATQRSTTSRVRKHLYKLGPPPFSGADSLAQTGQFVKGIFYRSELEGGDKVIPPTSEGIPTISHGPNQHHQKRNEDHQRGEVADPIHLAL